MALGSVPTGARSSAQVNSILVRQSRRCNRVGCPRCNKSLTAVNPRTNLGRCFRCELNFNAIDFVMLATDRDFVEAVHFLTDLLPAQPSRLLPPLPTTYRLVSSSFSVARMHVINPRCSLRDDDVAVGAR